MSRWTVGRVYLICAPRPRLHVRSHSQRWESVQGQKQKVVSVVLVSLFYLIPPLVLAQFTSFSFLAFLTPTTIHHPVYIQRITQDVSKHKPAQPNPTQLNPRNTHTHPMSDNNINYNTLARPIFNKALAFDSVAVFFFPTTPIHRVATSTFLSSRSYSNRYSPSTS